jgi:hypothetical protein
MLKKAEYFIQCVQYFTALRYLIESDNVIVKTEKSR